MSVDVIAVEALVERLHAVPRDARTFDVAPDDAHARFGLDERVLHKLDDAGLAEWADESKRYCEPDLHFIGVRSGQARHHLWAYALWARTLTKMAAGRVAAVNVRYNPSVLPHEEPRAGRAVTPEGELPVTIEYGVSACQFRVDMPPASAAAVPTPLQPMIDELSSYEFYNLSPELETPDFARRSGLIACGLAAQMLAQEATDLGMVARTSFGLILSVPFAAPHAWAEIYVDQEWLPVDPVFTGLLRRFGGLDPRASDTGRSLNKMLLRLGSEWRPLVTADDGSYFAMTAYVGGEPARPHVSVTC